MSFTIFYNEKTPFQAIKTRSLKSQKIAIILNELTHCFCTKMAIFPTLFFQAIQARKTSFTIFQNKKSPFQAIKTRSSNSRKTATFPKGLTHCFGPKIAIYPTSSFQVKEIRKMSFTIFQNENFLNGLTHGFWTKMAIFATSFF